MSHIAPALAALESGDHERAKSLLVQSYDHAPGESAAALARIALLEGEHPRAEALARTAIENHAPAALTTLADAVGRQGRRAEAEKIAADALSTNPRSGLLRAVLGEQRVRQAKWDAGTQDFIDALSLSERDAVIEQLWRVTRDLTIGHRADKVPTERALEFLGRIESGAPRSERPHDQLRELLQRGRQAIHERTVLPEFPAQRANRPPATAAPPTRPPPPAAAPARPPRRAPTASGAPPRREYEPLDTTAAPIQPGRRAPDLIATLRQDRNLNETLQEGLDTLGLPEWPSEHQVKLDTIPVMAPKNLEINQEEFRREYLNVTSGSVASEIIIERALQQLLLAIARTSAPAPRFDASGLTKLEVALWDGALNTVRPIPQVYLGDETRQVDEAVLAIGAFLGACVARPGVATWSFARDPKASTIELAHGNLEPFEIASRWVAADDKDDVHLEEFLHEVKAVVGLSANVEIHHDLTAGLEGVALAMRLAHLWLKFRMHPPETAQNQVAAAIRPLNVLDDITIFALGSEFAPRIGAASRRAEVAMAYLPRTGEFLVLSSRKHFARCVGVFCDELTTRNTASILDLFSTFHAPGAQVITEPEQRPKLERRGSANILQFAATIDNETKSYALVHNPGTALAWQLLEI